MHSSRYIAVIILLATFLPSMASGQKLAETLGAVTSQYAGPYVAPLTSAFGADYNTGLFHSADNGPRNGLNIYFGIKAFATELKGSDKSFSTSYSGSTNLSAVVLGEKISLDVPALFTATNAPTAFGSSEPGILSVSVKQDTTISFQGEFYDVRFDTTYTISTIGGIIDLPVMPAGAPQLEIGTFLGTDAMIRFVPPITNDEVGRLGLFGLGLRHSISQYFPDLPFHLAVQGVWQKLYLDDNEDKPIVDMQTWAANIQASKKFGILTVYGGLQIEDANIKVTYTFEPEALIEDGIINDDIGIVDVVGPVDLALDLDGSNLFRGIGGMNVALGPVVIAADANFGKVRSASLSLGVAF